MADRSVTVRLKVQDEFSAPVTAYTQKMQAADQATQKAAQGASRASQGFAQMGTALKGAIVGVGIMGVASLAEGLYSAGMNAQRAGMLFESFGTQVGSTSALLERLRGVTRGVVDDTTLMSAASTQLSMGLAKSADDVARLTNIGVTFAQAMGTDIGASMENLNMILANQSYLRLDTLGISSSQVRELAAQYRSAGMDTSEAFNAAFLDVAEQKLPQMTAVADAMVTPFQQLQASMNNFMADFGDNFAYLINEMARGIGKISDLIGGIFGSGGASQASVNASATAGIYADLYTSGGNPAGMLSSSNITGAIQAAIMADQSGIDAGSAEFLNLLTTSAFGFSATDSIFNTDAGQQMLQQAAGIVGWYQSYMAVVSSAQTGAASAALERTALADSMPRYAGMDDTSVARGPAFGGLMSRLLNRDYGQIGGFQGGVAYSDSGIADMQAAADRMREIADSAAEVKGMYSDFELDSLESAADYLEHMASDAENVRDALANATLQWGGGRRQEMYNGVLEAMQANGASQDQIAAFTQQFGMDSGAITGMSAQWEQTVAPALADMGEQLGAEAVMTWLDAYYAAQEDAMLREYTGPLALDLISQQAGIVPLSGSFAGGGGQSYTVRAGDTASAIAAQYGVSVASLGLDNPSLIYPGQQIGIGGAGGGMQFGYDPSMIGNAGDVGAETDRQAQVAADSYQYHLEGAFTSAVDTFTSLLNNAAAHVVQVPIEFVLLNGGAFNTLLAGAIATVTAANGGATPGATGNSGRSSSPRNSNSGAVNTANAIGGGI
jgi:LysM repeat protein